MRAIFSALIVCFALLACDTQNSAKLKATTSGPDTTNGDFLFDDESAQSPSGGTLLRVNSRIVSTSPDGTEADLMLTYTLDPSVRQALQPGAFVQFEYVAPNAPSRVVGKSTINDELGGSIEVTVPTDEEDATLVATIGGLEPGVIEDQGILVAQLPAILTRETTDLSRVNDLRAELVDGSYDSELVDGRRIHRFAVRVTDPTAGPIDDLLTDNNRADDLEYSISGLETNAYAHFVALENGVEDVESPVTVAFTEFPLAVYLVIDTSKSIVESRQVHNLINAVSSSVVALTQNAKFDYRIFNGQVSRIVGLRELDFDTEESSATALYYALDTALSDIENFGSISQDKVVMVFTDGKDRASRNHYNGDFIDNEQVHEYIVQRVTQVRRAQQNSLGRQMDVYTIGFYQQESELDVPEEIRKLDKIAEAGGTNASYNNLNATDIEDAFAAVVQNIRGVYYLQYSSQQTPDNNKLEVLVKVNGQEARIQLPTQFQEQ